MDGPNALCKCSSMYYTYKGNGTTSQVNETGRKVMAPVNVIARQYNATTQVNSRYAMEPVNRQIWNNLVQLMHVTCSTCFLPLSYILILLCRSLSVFSLISEYVSIPDNLDCIPMVSPNDEIRMALVSINSFQKYKWNLASEQMS